MGFFFGEASNHCREGSRRTNKECWAQYSLSNRSRALCSLSCKCLLYYILIQHLSWNIKYFQWCDNRAGISKDQCWKLCKIWRIWSLNFVSFLTINVRWSSDIVLIGSTARILEQLSLANRKLDPSADGKWSFHTGHICRCSIAAESPFYNGQVTGRRIFFGSFFPGVRPINILSHFYGHHSCFFYVHAWNWLHR